MAFFVVRKNRIAKSYFVGYHTQYGMELNWTIPFFVRSNEPSEMLASTFGDCRISEQLATRVCQKCPVGLSALSGWIK